MNSAHAAENDKWSGRVSVELKAGSGQEIGTLDVLAPLWQQPNRMLFSDVRLVDTSGTGLEGNLGLGFRKIEDASSRFGEEWAWGVYGFLDRRMTANENYFSQLNAGAEFFTENWVLRGNAYFPEHDGHTVATRGGPGEIALSGTAVVQQQSTLLEAKEYALPGMDVEIGRRFTLDDRQEFWLYAGYFNFDRSETPEIDGPRLRVEYRKYDVLRMVGSEISFGADIRHDDIRGTEELFVASLRIPLGRGASKKQRHVINNIERRMTEYVVRDRDIVSFEQDINKPVGSEGGPEPVAGSSGTIASTPVTDPATGEQLNVFIVNNSGGGDCSQASPCALAVAQANSQYGAGDVIVVTNSAGVVVGNVDLTTGASGTERRQVVGGAATVNLSLSSGDTLTVTGLGGRATLNGTVTLANDASIRNFDITSPGTGIVANGITNAAVDDVSISSAAAAGISLQNTSGTVAVSNSSITNASTAINLQSIGGSFSVSNTTISSSTIGVDLGGAATNASFTYQGGSINAGVPVNTVGITAGSYDFAGTTLTKDNSLSTATGFGGDFIFVDATGGGTGTSVNRASADFAETSSSAEDIIFLINNGTGNIAATNGLQLKNNQQLIGFASGPAVVDFTGSNAQVLGSFIYQISDPTGNGAATLTNSGGTEVVTLASGNQLRDFTLTTSGAVDGIAGNGFTGVTINNLAIVNAGADAFDFTNAAGSVTITDSSGTNSTGAGLRVNGGNATLALNNFDISDTGSGRSLDIQATTGGSVTFDANSTLGNSGGTGLLVNNLGGNVTFNGAVSVTNAVTTAIQASTLNGNTVAFNSGLGTVSTTGGTALLASGGTLNIAGTTTITATGAQALSLSNLTVGNGSGGALSFANVFSSGGANGIALTNIMASNGLNITSATLTNNTTAGLNVNALAGTLNIAAANVDTAAAGTGVAIAGVNGSLNIGSGGAGLDIDGGTSGVSINQAAGTVNLGTGASGVFAVDGTSGAGVILTGAGTVNIGTGGGSASIGATTTTTGTALAVTGGNASVSYNGTISNTSGTGIQVQNSAADVSVDGVTLVSSTTDAVTLSNNTGSFTLSNSTILNTTGSAITGSNTSNLTFDSVTINDAATSGDAIALTNATGTVSLLNSSITYDAAAADGLDIDNFALGAGTLTLIVDNTSFSGDTTSGGLQNAIDVVTSTTSTLDATITGSSFTNTWLDGIEIDINGTGGGDSVTIGTSVGGNTFTGVGGDVMDLSAQDNSNVNIDIRGNDADGNGLSVSDGIDLFIGDGAMATVDIVDNSVTNIGDGTTDETVKVFVGNTATANSNADITVDNNSISGNTATGLLVDVFGDSDANVTVNNNTFGSNGNNAGLTMITTTANSQACLAASGSSFGTDQITLTETADGSILRVPGISAVGLSSNNGGVTVNSSGGVGYNEACTIP